MNSCFRSMRFFSLFALFQYVSSSSDWDYTDEKTGFNAKFSAKKNYLKLTYGECILLFKSLSSEEIKKLENVSKDYFLDKIQTIAPPLQKRRPSNAINLFNLFALATDGSKEDPWERSVCISRDDIIGRSYLGIAGGVYIGNSKVLPCVDPVDPKGTVFSEYIYNSGASVDGEFDPFQSGECHKLDAHRLAYEKPNTCSGKESPKGDTKCLARCLLSSTANTFCKSAGYRRSKLFQALQLPAAVGQI